MGRNNKGEKKPKKNISLDDFLGKKDDEDNNDWARDDPNDPQNTSKYDPVKKTFNFTRKPGEKIGNFRNDERVVSSKIVDFDMDPPFLAFVANLLTGVSEADVRATFEEDELKILNMKIITRDRITFAFVEFETPQMLQRAVMLNGKYLRNRPMTIDVATKEQREKMKNDKASGTLGQGFPRGGSFPDREEMGTKQVEFDIGRGHRSPNTSGSGEFPNFREEGPQAQPMFQQPGMPQRQRSRDKLDVSNRRITPNSPGTPGGEFPNFREEGPQAQPVFQQPGMPQRQRSRDKLDPSSSSGNWREGPKQEQLSPTASDTRAPRKGLDGSGGNWREQDSGKDGAVSGGNWRDLPRQEQPSLKNSSSFSDSRPRKEGSGGNWRDIPRQEQPSMKNSPSFNNDSRPRKEGSGERCDAPPKEQPASRPEKVEKKETTPAPPVSNKQQAQPTAKAPVTAPPKSVWGKGNIISVLRRDNTKNDESVDDTANDKAKVEKKQ